MSLALLLEKQGNAGRGALYGPSHREDGADEEDGEHGGRQHQGDAHDVPDQLGASRPDRTGSLGLGQEDQGGRMPGS